MNKKFLWIVLFLVTIFLASFAYKYFDKAFPVVHISLSMDTKQAEQKAMALSQELQWDTASYDYVAMFEDDSLLQAFVELEGGGKQAYLDMITQDNYQPYRWKVRFYKEKEIKETFVYFTPDGKKYGFAKKLPEDMSGTNVSKSQAESIAESYMNSWDINLKNYKQVEYDQEVRPSKRVDHVFVYERHDITLKKGLYRIKVIVSGDEVTTLQRYVKIPDEFTRRYTQMFSTNLLVAQFATSITALLYLGIIAILSMLFLYRRRYFIIGPYKKLLSIIALLLAISACNNFPLIWSYYVTTNSRFVFMIQFLGMTVASILFLIIIIGCICFIAEAINRYVFAKQIQFFKLWSIDTVGSYEILKQTMIGYCFALCKLGYVVGFYWLVQRWGWWFPLTTLFNPNILSAYVPFLTPVITAFRAGFLEEFAFRVLPIGGTLLLTKNSKHQRYWIIAIFIVQALLFGAAHANYPQQPAYCRIVEMFAHSIVYGLIYYILGILPIIVAHFVYDAILMFIPIWISSLLLQKFLAVLGILFPLLVVLFARIRQGAFKRVPESSYNEAFTSIDKPIAEKSYTRLLGNSVHKSVIYGLYLFGFVGLLLFYFSKECQFDTPAVSITKTEAVQKAHIALQDRFAMNPDSDYQELVSFIHNVATDGHNFIYQEYGRKGYDDLQNSYIMPPYYSIRYAKFTGPVEQRAEEYGVWVSATGMILNIWHKLPEAMVGEDIFQKNAENLAYQFVDKEFGLSKKDTELVSIDSIKHENRRDWKVVLRDKINYDYDKGQARILIEIGGDQVIGVMRYIHAPEEWIRKEQERVTKKAMISLVSFWITLFMLFLFVFLVASQYTLQSTFIRLINNGILFFIVLRIIALWLRWDQIIFEFNTSQPFINQILSLSISYLLLSVFIGFMTAILLLLTFLACKKGLSKDFAQLIIPSIAAGCGFYGIFAYLGNFEMQFGPMMPLLYNFLNFKSSSLAMILMHTVLEPIGTFIYIVAVMVVAHYFYQRFGRQEIIKLLIFIIGGFATVGTSGHITPLWLFALLGLAWGVIWHMLCRYLYVDNIEMLLITIWSIQIMRLIPSIYYHAYPHIILHALWAMIISLGIVIFCVKMLQRE